MFAPAHLLALAPVAEDAGFTSVAVPESVFFPREVSADYPYSPDGSRFWAADTPFTDPVVAISAMAAITTTLRFVTNVVKAPLRHPLLLAKQVSSLAAISGDRVDLGVGSSWIPEEFEWLGESMRTRGARLDEIIDIVRLVCDGGNDWVEFHGRHYDFGPLPSWWVVTARRRCAVPCGSVTVGSQCRPPETRSAPSPTVSPTCSLTPDVPLTRSRSMCCAST
jgi:alkanesulfonate monooxygenase SsuD/methylene tetrahydromethanopterin reductase-like flavin-dependent oxidoreductase (luciferase family)